ncbi:hypothetical protein PR048_011308, partial [Dryococelus australis]
MFCSWQQAALGKRLPEEHQTKVLVLSVTFKGNPCYLLMNTGAQISLMSHKMFQGMQKLFTPQFTVIGLNGKSVPNLGECDVDILINQDAYTLCVQVVESPCNQYDGILGLDFLKLNHATINVAKQKLYLRNKSYVLEREPDKESISTKVVRMGEHVHLKAADDLPPGTGKRVQVNVVLPVSVDCSDVLVKPVLENYFLKFKHCYVARGISHVSYDNGNKVLATVKVLEAENILPCDEVNPVVATECNIPEKVSARIRTARSVPQVTL